MQAKDIPQVAIKDNLPVFSDRIVSRMNFPMSWLSGHFNDFQAWKQMAREKVMAVRTNINLT